MKALKPLLVMGVTLLIGFVIAGLFFTSQRTVRTTARPDLKPAATSVAAQGETPPMAVPTAARLAVTETPPRHDLPHPPKPATADAKPQQVTPRAKTGAKPKPEVQDPVARLALSFVGADPEAEAYWYGAINDPSLPANERKDLIEDLNEDGLSDPRRPGPEDLPLILSRLALIEEAAPYALDTVNAEAFQEAYKDLVNMAARLAQR